MSLSDFKTILIYKSPIPFYTTVGAVQSRVLSGRYDKIMDVQAFSMRNTDLAEVAETLHILGVSRHHMAIFDSVGDDIGIQMGITQAKLNKCLPELPKHLTEVKH